MRRLACFELDNAIVPQYSERNIVRPRAREVWGNRAEAPSVQKDGEACSFNDQ